MGNSVNDEQHEALQKVNLGEERHKESWNQTGHCLLQQQEPKIDLKQIQSCLQQFWKNLT